LILSEDDGDRISLVAMRAIANEFDASPSIRGRVILNTPRPASPHIFHDVDGKRREVAYRLVLTGKGWRVADMTLLGTSPDGWLVAVLKAKTAELHRRSIKARD
jgi:hypothetical protein